MVTRAWVLVLAIVLAGCATAQMSTGDARRTTRGALDEAGLSVEDLEVIESGGGTHTVRATTPVGDIVLVLDAGSGRFTSIDIDEDVDVSARQLDALARHHDNPADDRSRARRSVVAVVVILVAVTGGLVLARRARLREEAAENDHRPAPGAGR